MLLVQSVLGKLPLPLLVLNKQIQRPLQCSVQALCVVLLVRLSTSRHRLVEQFSLNLLHALLFSCTCFAPIGRRVLEKFLNLVLHLAFSCSDKQLVVPSLVTITLVSANIACRRQPLLHLAFPFQVRGCALLEVKVACEGESETFVQALLVEKEGGLERVQVAG
jgi:hypothetical protein